jgi:hypothetical protein
VYWEIKNKGQVIRATFTVNSFLNKHVHLGDVDECYCLDGRAYVLVRGYHNQLKRWLVLEFILSYWGLSRNNLKQK